MRVFAHIHNIIPITNSVVANTIHIFGTQDLRLLAEGDFAVAKLEAKSLGRVLKFFARFRQARSIYKHLPTLTRESPIPWCISEMSIYGC
jgi:hypothetical protein